MLRAISIALYALALVCLVVAFMDLAQFFGRFAVAVVLYIGGAVVASIADRRVKRGSE